MKERPVLMPNQEKYQELCHSYVYHIRIQKPHMMQANDSTASDLQTGTPHAFIQAGNSHQQTTPLFTLEPHHLPCTLSSSCLSELYSAMMRDCQNKNKSRIIKLKPRTVSKQNNKTGISLTDQEQITSVPTCSRQQERCNGWLLKVYFCLNKFITCVFSARLKEEKKPVDMHTEM